MSDGPENRIGEIVFGRYQLTGILGSGGVGTVYEANDQRLSRRVAVKILHNRACLRGAERRLQREARTLAALAHPNLVTLLDYDQLPDGSPAMVMEYVDGDSLGRTLKNRNLTPVEIASVLDQVLSALERCHAQGIIHRDLKPANLLMERGGGPPVARLIDFGIVHLLGDQGVTALTMAGEVFGTPRFMAPEQWQQQGVDGRTDIYALGIMGYCMVLGDHFISAGNPVEVFNAHLRGPRPTLTTTRGGHPVPPELAAALAKAVDPSPERRFATAAEMRAALDPVLEGERGRSTGEYTREGPPARRISQPLAPPPFAAAPTPVPIASPTPVPVASPGAAPVLFTVGPSRQTTAGPSAAAFRGWPSNVPTDPGSLPPVTSEPEERVVFGVRGGVRTAITRGDVERALSGGPGEVEPESAGGDGLGLADAGGTDGGAVEVPLEKTLAMVTPLPLPEEGAERTLAMEGLPASYVAELEAARGPAWARPVAVAVEPVERAPAPARPSRDHAPAVTPTPLKASPSGARGSTSAERRRVDRPSAEARAAPPPPPPPPGRPAWHFIAVGAIVAATVLGLVALLR